MKTTCSILPNAFLFLLFCIGFSGHCDGSDDPDQLLDSYLETGSYEFVERIREGFPGSPHEKFCDAWEYMDANNDKSRDLSSELVSEHPDFAPGHFALGTVLAFGFKEYDESIAHLDRCIEIEPDFTEAYLNRGIAKIGTGDYHAAKEDFEYVLQQKRGFARAFLLRGIAENGLGDEEAMKADFEIGLQMDYRALSEIPGDLAEPAMNRAIEAAPDNAIYYFARGYLHFEKGNYRLASADFDKCIELVPGSSDFYKYSGASKMNIEDFTGGQKDLNYALSVNPDDPETYYFLAVLMNDFLKEPAIAREYMNYAIGLEKNSARFYYERSKAAYQMMDYQEARDDINRALLLDHRKGDYYVLRGYIKMKTGNDPDDFCADFRKAVEWGTAQNLKRVLKRSCK